jgi:hypothetical protein
MRGRGIGRGPGRATRLKLREMAIGGIAFPVQYAEQKGGAGMKPFTKLLVAMAVLAGAVAVWAPSPSASSEHFVFLNDNDFQGNGFQGNDRATVIQLEGTLQNPALKQTALLDSGVPSVEVSNFVPTIQVVRAGTDTCIFMADSNGPESLAPNEITSFKYPSMTPVGSFSDPNVPIPQLGTAIVAHGGYLFAAYNGYQNLNYLATWQIGSGCTLHLVWMSPPFSVNQSFCYLAVTPDGKTLVTSASFCCNDSFSIGDGGVLTEHGPYSEGGTFGLDITADSKFAIFSLPNQFASLQVWVQTINSDGSLGFIYDFGNVGELGMMSPGYVRLSPDGRFIYVDGGDDHGGDPALTVLSFTENPVNVAATGCSFLLRTPPGSPTFTPGTMATAATYGAGGDLYIAGAEGIGGPSIVSLLTIDPNAGCPTEVRGSPFVLSDNVADVTSLVAWPPRPF